MGKKAQSSGSKKLALKKQTVKDLDLKGRSRKVKGGVASINVKQTASTPGCTSSCSTPMCS